MAEKADRRWIRFVWTWVKHLYAVGGEYYRRGQTDDAREYFDLARKKAEEALAYAAADEGASRATSYQLLHNLAVIAVDNPFPTEERLQAVDRVMKHFPADNDEAAPYRLRLLIKRVDLRTTKQQSLASSSETSLEDWDAERERAEQDLVQAIELTKRLDAPLRADCAHKSAQIALNDYFFYRSKSKDKQKKEDKARHASKLLDAAQRASNDVQDCYEDCIVLGQLNHLIVNEFAQTAQDKRDLAGSALKALERIGSIEDVNGDGEALRTVDGLRAALSPFVP
jgi:hypothetical protein